jgi:hypothetical protein
MVERCSIFYQEIKQECVREEHIKIYARNERNISAWLSAEFWKLVDFKREWGKRI